ncbi:UTP-glucose-1-phosphate uridylyltransferase [Trifolium pratense]|uniref:UTP-glucose-1-phosphate uridylyltransferase n=2 Tax=Trifolium pratense TaxID=57577 RepID=A0A2K3NS93_TRIPR|nr:UTP-glucose-1-phosphate uridylyltransferase [Trifolium pratense]
MESDLFTLVDGSVIRNRVRANPENPSIELGTEKSKIYITDYCVIIVELDSLKVDGDVWFGVESMSSSREMSSIIAKSGVKLKVPDGAVTVNKVFNRTWILFFRRDVVNRHAAHAT